MASQDGGLTDSLGAFQDELVDIDRKSSNAHRILWPKILAWTGMSVGYSR